MDKTPRQIATETAQSIVDGEPYTDVYALHALAREYLRLSTQSSRGGSAGTQAQHAARVANGKRGGRPRKNKSEKPVDKPEGSG